MKILASSCLLAAAVLLGACGSSTNLTCGTVGCSPGSSGTYETCIGAAGAVTYNYNGTSCDCNNSALGGCSGCANSLAAYCNGLTASGDAGTDASSSTDGSVSQCSFVGTFKNTLANGGMVTIVASGAASAGTFSLDIVVGQNTTTILGNFSVSGNQITMTNTSATPSSVMGCIGEAAIYGLTWTPDCGKVTFAKVSDTCTGRIGDANGATLTRQ